MAELQRARFDAAWDLFLDRYRRLIFAAIRHYAQDYEDVMDVFARVCEALREDGFARLRRCAAHVDPARPFSTFLVVVVHNLTIDWFRHRNGRLRLGALAAGLPPLQQSIFRHVFLEERSHAETYELLRSGAHGTLGYHEFLGELRATYRAATSGRNHRLLAALAAPPAPASPDSAAPDEDPAVRAEQRAIVAAALAALPPEDRLAVQLYVVDDMPAEQVARALGYPGPKTVYNRVYRALSTLRARLAQVGIGKGDL
ncbi:MAG: RNA polymerase sigma factor [bacterium]